MKAERWFMIDWRDGNVRSVAPRLMLITPPR